MNKDHVIKNRTENSKARIQIFHQEHDLIRSCYIQMCRPIYKKKILYIFTYSINNDQVNKKKLVNNITHLSSRPLLSDQSALFLMCCRPHLLRSIV